MGDVFTCTEAQRVRLSGWIEARHGMLAVAIPVILNQLDLKWFQAQQQMVHEQFSQ